MPNKPSTVYFAAKSSRYTGSLTHLVNELMTYRTPAALAWLIRQRATLQGEILKLEKEIADFTDVKQEEIQKLKAKLGALDQTFELHDIQIDPEGIPAVRRRNPEDRIPLTHGQFTRLILSCMREAKGEPRSTTEIAAYILEHADIFVPPEEINEFRRKIKRRLGNLMKEKKVRRLHDPKSNDAGVWMLAI